MNRTKPEETPRKMEHDLRSRNLELVKVGRSNASTKKPHPSRDRDGAAGKEKKTRLGTR